MYRTEYLYLKGFEGLSQWNVRQLLTLFFGGFDEQKGFGFIGTEALRSSIDSTLIYRSIVFRRVFDTRNNALVVEEQMNFYRVPFRLDLDAELLQAYAGGKRLEKLLSILSQVFDFKITITDILIDMNKLMTQLRGSDLSYSITGITINNFRPETGLSGRYVARVDSSELAQQLIDIYGTDVTDIEIELLDYEDVVAWRLTSTGKLSVRAREDSLEEQARALKHIALRCQNA